MKEVKDILKVLLEGYEKGGNPLSIDWVSIAGEELAEHSQFKGIDNKTLLVDVPHSGWKQIFLMNQREILDKIRKFYPDFEIQKIKINILDDKKNNFKDSNMQKIIEDKPDLEKIINNVSNPEFREYLKKLNKRFDKD